VSLDGGNTHLKLKLGSELDPVFKYGPGSTQTNGSRYISVEQIQEGIDGRRGTGRQPAQSGSQNLAACLVDTLLKSGISEPASDRPLRDTDRRGRVASGRTCRQRSNQSGVCSASALVPATSGHGVPLEYPA
jgi:hypothetical protein